jgi:3-oxoacyl-[acyl-carrier protein] reductase
LVRNVPEEKMESLLQMQAIPRYGTFEDISNVLDFFLQEGSDFITGQVIYLGGVS